MTVEELRRICEEGTGLLRAGRIPEPPLEPRRGPSQPVCPRCGETADTFFTDWNGDVAGCENCVRMEDAWEYLGEV